MTCELCGYGLRYGESWHSYGNRDGKVWHNYCMGYERHKADAAETLAVLDLVCEVWDVSGGDVRNLAELRAVTEPDRARDGDRVFRVMRSLDALRDAR